MPEPFKVRLLVLIYHIGAAGDGGGGRLDRPDVDGQSYAVESTLVVEGKYRDGRISRVDGRAAWKQRMGWCWTVIVGDRAKLGIER